MKLYDFTSAPNPRRVRIFLAEKGVTVPLQQVDLFQGANRSPEALKRNIGSYFQHTHEIFKNRIRQLPAVAEASRETALARMRLIDGLIAERRFIAGERYTIADITAIVAFGLGEFAGLTIPSDMRNISRWYAEVSARPSARA